MTVRAQEEGGPGAVRGALLDAPPAAPPGLGSEPSEEAPRAEHGGGVGDGGDAGGGSGGGGRGGGGGGDDDRLVVLTKVGDEVEGRLLVGMLEAHGVRAMLSGLDSSGYRAHLSRARVLVRRGDLALARELLEVPSPELGDEPWAP